MRDVIGGRQGALLAGGMDMGDMGGGGGCISGCFMDSISETVGVEALMGGVTVWFMPGD